MNSSEGKPQETSATAEIVLVSGQVYRVEGRARDVERIILDAARGSIMQLAWLTDADTGNELGINPEHVVLLRAPIAQTPHQRGGSMASPEH